MDEMTQGSVAVEQSVAPELPAAQAQETATDTPQATNEAPSKASTVAVWVDPETGRRQIVIPEQSAQPQGGTSTEGQYSANELFKSYAEGNVDPARVPDDLKGYYLAIQRQQELYQAQQAQALQQQQMLAAQQAQEAVEQQSVPAVNQAEILMQMQEAAKGLALRDLGMTEDEYDGAEYSDDEEVQRKAKAVDAATQINLQRISAQIDLQQRQAQMQELERNKAVAELLPKYQEFQRDPHYSEIDAMMGEHYKTMPYQDAVKIEAAIRRVKNYAPIKQDVNVLLDYYQKTREAFYQKLSGLKKTPQPAARPPRVEASGQTAQGGIPKTVWKTMRSMGPRDRSEFFRSHITRVS